MTLVHSYQPHPTFFIRKAGSRYAYEKTLRGLLRKIETNQFQPFFDRGTASWNFREAILRPYAGDSIHLPRTFEAWQGILDKIFTKLNLSRGIMIGRNENGERFAPAVRSAHKNMTAKRLVEICMLENWFYYNKNVLREIVDNF